MIYLKRNQTPLVVASELGHIEVAEVLIRNGADLNIQEKVFQIIEAIIV